jgi:O-antigen/teichoic acid export membrane protein
MAVLAIVAPVLVPALFGPHYRAAVPLVWILCPGGVLLTCNQVVGDLLRGRNQTLWVAFGQGAGAVVTGGLLAALIPPFGVTGAAITTSAAYAVTFVVLVIGLGGHAPAEAHRGAGQGAVNPEAVTPEGVR